MHENSIIMIANLNPHRGPEIKVVEILKMISIPGYQICLLIKPA